MTEEDLKFAYLRIDFDRRSLALHTAMANLHDVSSKVLVNYAADVEHYLTNGKSSDVMHIK